MQDIQEDRIMRVLTKNSFDQRTSKSKQNINSRAQPRVLQEQTDPFKATEATSQQQQQQQKSKRPTMKMISSHSVIIFLLSSSVATASATDDANAAFPSVVSTTPAPIPVKVVSVELVNPDLCSVCGDGKAVTNHDAEIQLSGELQPTTCGTLSDMVTLDSSMLTNVRNFQMI